MVAQASLNTATCPTCKGSGQRQKERGHEKRNGSVTSYEVAVRCLACRGEGRVEAARVCSGCGCWLDACKCPPLPHGRAFVKVLAPRPKRSSVEIVLGGDAAGLRSAPCEINAAPVPLPENGGGKSRKGSLVSSNGSTVSAELSAPARRLQECRGWKGQACALKPWWGSLWRCGLCAGFEIDEE